MRRTALVVFEVLEKAWAARDCALIDMKIEFGIHSKGTVHPLALLQILRFSSYNVLHLRCMIGATFAIKIIDDTACHMLHVDLYILNKL
jgi:hypothetical protein